jgi:hypothetical protein
MEMMQDQDIIDLEDFSIKPGEKDDPPVPPIAGEGDEPPDPTSPDMQNLLKQVAELKETFEKSQVTEPSPPEPEAKAPVAPTNEEIAAAFEAGKTMEGVALMQQQFSINNFVPAMKDLATNLQDQTKKTEEGTTKALAHSAAQAIKDAVYADPGLVAVKDRIFEKFRGASPEAIMMPGVIANVIQQTVGELAMKGEWTGTVTTPTNVIEGDGGPQASDVDPRMVEVFKKLTGQDNVDAEMVATLSKPHLINLGTGEG